MTTSGLLTVRRASEQDARVLHDIAAETFPLACPPGTRPADIAAHIATTLSEGAMGGYLLDPQRDLFLARLGTVAVGYSMLVVGEPADPDVAAAVSARPTAELSKCYVLPSAHRTGIGHALIEASVAAAEARGAASVWLGVNAQNSRADAFYVREGFERVGARRYRVGSEWHDDIVRERRAAALPA
jgi:ribosomal protein S18 acetylase RimI-like enzyme